MCALCSQCWGPGKTFGDVPTPTEVPITIYGIQKGQGWTEVDPEPPNGCYTLYQDPLYPCRFSFSDGTWIIHWWAEIDGGSRLSIELIGVTFAFESDRDLICKTYFTNDIDDGPEVTYYGGAALAFDTWIPDRIALDYAFLPFPDFSHYFYELTTEQLVLRLRNRFDFSRLFVKYNDGA